MAGTDKAVSDYSDYLWIRYGKWDPVLIEIYKIIYILLLYPGVLKSSAGKCDTLAATASKCAL